MMDSMKSQKPLQEDFTKSHGRGSAYGNGVRASLRASLLPGHFSLKEYRHEISRTHTHEPHTTRLLR